MRLSIVFFILIFTLGCNNQQQLVTEKQQGAVTESMTLETIIEDDELNDLLNMNIHLHQIEKLLANDATKNEGWKKIIKLEEMARNLPAECSISSKYKKNNLTYYSIMIGENLHEVEVTDGASVFSISYTEALVHIMALREAGVCSNQGMCEVREQPGLFGRTDTVIILPVARYSLNSKSIYKETSGIILDRESERKLFLEMGHDAGLCE